MAFNHILATEFEVGYPWKENYREDKKESTVKLINRLELAQRSIIFFTDHLDDLPLIACSQLLVWFGNTNDLVSINEQYPNLPTLHSVDGRDWTVCSLKRMIES